MKKFVFIILAIQILSSGQFLNEVVKISNLVEHYRDHRRACSNMNVAMFIQLHYFDPIHKDSDPKKHASLPLHNTCCFVSIVFHSPVETPTFISINSESSTPVLMDMQENIHTRNLSSVFQPPRTV